MSVKFLHRRFAKGKYPNYGPLLIHPPGTFKGEVLGPAIEGTARRLTGSEFKRARDLLRVGVVGHFWGIIFDLRYPGEKTAVYEISLVAEGVDQEMKASDRAFR